MCKVYSSRILSILLMFCLIFTAFPAISFGTESASSIPVNETATQGKNTWTLDNINISGAAIDSFTKEISGNSRIYNLKLDSDTNDNAQIDATFDWTSTSTNGFPFITDSSGDLLLGNVKTPKNKKETSVVGTLKNGETSMTIYCAMTPPQILGGQYYTYVLNFSKSKEVTGTISKATINNNTGQWMQESDLYAAGKSAGIVTVGGDKTDLTVETQSGIDLYLDNVKQTKEEGTDESYRLQLPSSKEGLTHKIELKRGEKVDASYEVVCYSQLYSGLPDAVTDYLCIGSQYTNGGAPANVPYGLNQRAVATLRGGSGDAVADIAKPPVSVGNFGGYITYYYKDAVTDNPNNPYGIDFIVNGNSVDGTEGFAEPGNVLVSEDGQKWYNLAGSLHYDDDAVWDYQVTYTPNKGKTSYADNKGNSGALSYPYPTKSYYSLFKWTEELEKSISLNGVLLRAADGTNQYGNTLPLYPAFGYTDCGIKSDSNAAANPYTGIKAGNKVTSGRTDGFDLSWAVDEAGQPVKLNNGVHYIKVQTATLIQNGSIGEKSTEVNMVRTAGPKTAEVGKTAAPESITVDGNKIDLKDGQPTYDAAVSGVFDVSVDGADDANIYINSTRDAKATFENAAHNMIRVIVQQGQKEPLIYYLNIKDDGKSKDNKVSAVTLDANGGQILDQKKLTNYYDKDSKVKDFPDPVREDYTFLGWYSGQTKYDGYKTSMPEKLTLTAKWQSNTPPAQPSDKKIKVSFRLVGATLSKDGVDLSKDKSDSNYVTWIKTADWTIAENSKVSDLFTAALKKAGLKEKGAEAGYVKTINAPTAFKGYELSEMTNGPYSGWMYTVNGEHPDKALTEKVLQDGDAVVWHYVNDYRYEVADWDKLGGGAFPSLGDGKWHDGWLKAADTAPKDPTKPVEPTKPTKPTKPKPQPDKYAAFKKAKPVVKLERQSRTQIKVSWKKVKNADGYAIYRATKKSGKYSKIKTVSAKKSSYIDKKKTTGKTYYYKVRAYQKVNGKNIYTKLSSVKGLKVKVPTPVMKTKVKKGSITVSWKKVTGADKYQVYKASSKNGKYYKMRETVKTSFKDTRVKKNKTYYYKVRAYEKVKGKKTYSSFTKVKKVKAK